MENPDWIPDIDEEHDSPLIATLSINPETRICDARLVGPVDWILQFLQADAADGLLKRLQDEAAFDRLVIGFNNPMPNPPDVQDN
jgi:hypothetical protein|tara:strand:+ start:368 stop:622 length:255 start_codon:yes stop_codon:yes gene_type:complete